MRPDKDNYFLSLAKLVSTRGTCIRRSVGCVLIDSHSQILATGYNGVATGVAHCNDPTEFFRDGAPKTYGNSCSGANAKSGESLDSCQAIHAEQNALLQCRNQWEITTCYSTALPCISCAKLLMNTSCRRVVYLESYPHKEAVLGLFAKLDIEAIHLPI